MRRIAIVGAGQAGLQLALALQARGYEVTVVADRDAARVEAGPVLSTQVMFGTSLAIERGLGLDWWADQAPRIAGMGVAVAGPDGEPVVDWYSPLREPAQSVDQRLKMPAWMRAFAERGGNLVVARASVADLDAYALDHDLVLVATGRGELAAAFGRDASRSAYERPMRALAVAYVHGLAPRAGHGRQSVRINIVPGVGEAFLMPALTLSGPCDILLIEGVPGGPFDVFGQVSDPDAILAGIRDLLARHVPWEYANTAGVRLTDPLGVLRGRFAPVVREPVLPLPSGRAVLGIADAVVLNDPIAGQGANSAAKAAATHLADILDHGPAPYDLPWLHRTADRSWQYARHAVRLASALLEPPPDHVLAMLSAAAERPAVASRFVNGYDDPTDFADWLYDPDRMHAYLAAGGP
jgi:Styrene monooxygenase A putative substrate binding domain/Pyridine nucleotide-disulphide oxidoreductase